MRWHTRFFHSIGSGSGSSRLLETGSYGRFIGDDLLPLLARLCIGTIFWRSGQTKLEGWHIADGAIYLFQTEYKLPFIDPRIAATLTAINENVFSLLLLVGLASRAAALVLLGTTLVIEIFVYPDAWPVHGTWAVCLVLVIIRGAGTVSLDHLIVSRQIGRAHV